MTNNDKELIKVFIDSCTDLKFYNKNSRSFDKITLQTAELVRLPKGTCVEMDDVKYLLVRYIENFNNGGKYLPSDIVSPVDLAPKYQDVKLAIGTIVIPLNGIPQCLPIEFDVTIGESAIIKILPGTELQQIDSHETKIVYDESFARLIMHHHNIIDDVLSRLIKGKINDDF